MLGWNQVPSPRSFTRWRHHQTRSLVRVFAGLDDLVENIVCVIARPAPACCAKNASSSGSRDAMSSSGSPSASLNRAVHVSPSAALMPFELAAREAVGEREDASSGRCR